MNQKELYEVLMAHPADTSRIPKGKSIFYRCKKCEQVVPSLPRDNGGCSCGNIFVDVDTWRLAVMDYSTMEVLRRQKG